MVQLDFGPSRYGHSAPVTPCSGMEVIEQCPLLAQSGHREVPKRTSFEPLRYSILPSGQAMRGHEFIKFLGGATAAWPLADTGSYRSGKKHNCCASVTKGGGRVSYQVSFRQAVVRKHRRDNVPRGRCNDACLCSSNVQALKDRPQVNVQEVLKNHPDLKKLPCHPNPDPGYKLAC